MVSVITHPEAYTAPYTMRALAEVSNGETTQAYDVLIPNDAKRCRPKIEAAIAHELGEGWTVTDWLPTGDCF